MIASLIAAWREKNGTDEELITAIEQAIDEVYAECARLAQEGANRAEQSALRQHSGTFADRHYGARQEEAMNILCYINRARATKGQSK